MKFFGALILIISCFVFCSFLFKKTPERRRIAFKIIDEVSCEAERKYNLRRSGVIQACPDGIYSDIGINFDYRGVLDKAEGRKIIIDIVDAFLEKINSNESFKKYLKDVPFTGDNVTVNIFLKPAGGELFYPNIKIFSFYSDKLLYEYDTPESYKKRGDYYLTETEMFEEAKKLAGK